MSSTEHSDKYTTSNRVPEGWEILDTLNVRKKYVDAQLKFSVFLATVGVLIQIQPSDSW